MNVILSGEYKPTAQELANEIWNMPVFDQVELLYCLANIGDKPAMYRQMSFINDELKEDPENYASIIKFIKKLHEYCTGK